MSPTTVLSIAAVTLVVFAGFAWLVLYAIAGVEEQKEADRE